jgi:hypothetical protein
MVKCIFGCRALNSDNMCSHPGVQITNTKTGEDQGGGPRKTYKEMGNIHIRGKINQIVTKLFKTIMWI